MRWTRITLLMLLSGGVWGCAPTTPSSAPPVEVLVVVSDGEERSILLVPTDRIDSTTTIPLGPGAGRITSLAVHGRYAAIGLAEADQMMLVDLATGTRHTLVLEAGGTLSSVGFASDGVGYALTQLTGTVTRFHPSQGILSRTTYSGGPRHVVSARGRTFVLFGPREVVDCTDDVPVCKAIPGWLSPLQGGDRLDSLPLQGGGNPNGAVVTNDGTLYILNRGGEGVPGSLSAFDPVRERETATFYALGEAPLHLAYDGGEHLLITSRTDGLLVFNTRQRGFERGVGSGIPLPRRPRALATDGLGRTYVVEAEGCGGTVNGRVRVFGRDLVEGPTIPVGNCPVAAAVTEVPPGLNPS